MSIICLTLPSRSNKIVCLELQLVISTGHGVNGFTLDPALGEFILTHSNIKVHTYVLGTVSTCTQISSVIFIIHIS